MSGKPNVERLVNPRGLTVPNAIITGVEHGNLALAARLLGPVTLSHLCRACAWFLLFSAPSCSRVTAVLTTVRRLRGSRAATVFAAAAVRAVYVTTRTSFADWRSAPSSFFVRSGRRGTGRDFRRLSGELSSPDDDTLFRRRTTIARSSTLGVRRRPSTTFFFSLFRPVV